MDNFRKHKTPRTTARGAIDGFVGSEPRGGRVVRRGSLSVKQSSVSNIDSFKGSNGFRPSAQNRLKTSGSPESRTGRHGAAKLSGNVPVDLPPSSAEKGKKRRRKSKKFKILLTIFLIIVLAGGFVFGNAFLKARKIFGGGGNAPALSADVDPTQLKGEGDGRVNILLLGKGGAGHEGADLTDTLLIASIDPVQKDASLLSIPRDFWVKTDKGQSKINAVYANAKYGVLNSKKTSDSNERAEQAGLTAVEETIEEVTGIPIHYYVMVDFVAFEKAINTVGGINIDVGPNATVYERLFDTTTRKQYILDVKEGPSQFDGKRALFYARSRATSARGDFDRAERQRSVIVALKDKIMSAGTYGNPVKVNQLINEFGGNVRSNLSTGEVLRVYDLMKTIDSSKIDSVGLADQPNVLVETANLNGQSIVQPIAGLYNYTALQSFIRNRLKDGFIEKENASIAVYNGSGISGLAGKRSEELKSFGYNITTVANAPAGSYPKTILVDLTAGKKEFTKNYLEQRLKVTSTTTLPTNAIAPSGAEFVIILGQNESASQ